jgi:hypothetical protein
MPDNKKYCLACGILSPELDWCIYPQPAPSAAQQLDDDQFHELIWKLHDSGKCVVPESDWVN